MNELDPVRPWEILDSEFVLDHRWYKVRRDTVRLPDGRILDDYFTSVRPEIVLVFPLSTDGTVHLLRQYRHGAGEVLLEFPGGIVDAADDSTLAAAQRELREECGLEADTWEYLGFVYDDPSKQNNRLHLYLAHDVEPTEEMQLMNRDATEFLEILEITITDLRQENNQIQSAGGLALMYRAFAALDEYGFS